MRVPVSAKIGSMTRNAIGARARSALELDDAAVIADDLCHQRQTQPLPLGLVVTKGSNKCGRRSSRDARSFVVGDAHHQRQLNARGGALLRRARQG